MNRFCANCPHKNIPQKVKSYFNELAGATFIECPANDPKIIGCFIKKYNIDWFVFVKYLYEDAKIITKEEMNNIHRIIKNYKNEQ